MKYAQVFLSLLTIGTAAQAAVVNVSPSDQTDVTGDGGAADTNFSSGSYTRIGWSTSAGEGVDGLWSTLMKFNIPAPGDAGTITAATLTLNLTYVQDQGSLMAADAHYSSDDSWSAGTVTWNTQPSPSAVTDFQNGLGPSSTSVTFNVLSFIQQAGEGFGNSLTVNIEGRNNVGGITPYQWMRVGKGAPGDGAAPILSITYTSVPEPAGMSALICFGGAAMLRRQRRSRGDL